MIYALIDDLSFELDTKSFTAHLINSCMAKGNVFLPRSINYHSQEYLLTEIKANSFKGNNSIYSIEFPEDSALRKIEKKSFKNSSIERITIPSSLEELEEEWCADTKYLCHVSIHPNNKRYKFYDKEKKILIGKSDTKSDIFDLLVFACRDIKDVIIPSTIKHICSFAFSDCTIKLFEYEENSELETVGRKIFDKSDISDIKIPPKLKYCGDDILGGIWTTVTVSVLPGNENFKKIDNSLIVCKSNPDQEDFDVLLFADRKIENAIIPSTIKCIAPFSFFLCNKLKSIQFSEDSQLNSIKKFAFAWSKINSIEIPSKVKIIEKEAFSNCFDLETVIFSENSELNTICERAFYSTKIKIFTIPSNVERIEGSWLSCNQLEEIKISSGNKNFRFLDEDHKILIEKSDPKSSEFDILLFSYQDTDYLFIPSFIKYIESCVFNINTTINTIEFDKNSNLKIIKKYAFSDSYIEEIKIPPSVTHLESFCFFNCHVLRSIEISEDSQLLSIGEYAFENTLIEKIFIPSKTIKIEEKCFVSMYNIKRIIISPENKKFGYISGEEEKTIVEKSNIGNDYYDILLFTCIDKEEIIIPSMIKKVNSYSFYASKQLKRIKFLPDSNLEIIENNSFTSSEAEEIIMPPKVKFIGEYAFSNCKKLKSIDLSNLSKLNILNKKLFSQSSIENISIPSNIVEIRKECFSHLPNLNHIELAPVSKSLSYFDDEKRIVVCKSDVKSDIFDNLVFVNRDIKNLIIPSSIKCICSFALFNSKVEYVKISKSVNIIENNAFDQCGNLKEIEFEYDRTENIEIQVHAFAFSKIKSISIPAKNANVELLAFYECINLHSIEIIADEINIDWIYVNHDIFIFSFPESKTISKDTISFQDTYLEKIVYVKPYSVWI